MTYPGQPMAQPARPTLAAPRGGSGGLNARNLDQRACAVIVHSYDPTATMAGKIRPSMVADFYVLDGGEGPILFGDGVSPPSPHTHSVQPSAFFGNVLISGPVAERCGAYAGTNQPVGGRFRLGDKATAGNKPWLFVELGSDMDPRKAEAAQVTEALIDLIVAKRTGQWTPPTPVELVPQRPQQPAYAAAPVGPTPQVSYGPPQLPPVPSLPKLPSLPTAPTNPGWDEGLRAHGWTPEVWQQAYPAMPADQRAQWAALAVQPTH